MELEAGVLKMSTPGTLLMEYWWTIRDDYWWCTDEWMNIQDTMKLEHCWIIPTMLECKLLQYWRIQCCWSNDEYIILEYWWILRGDEYSGYTGGGILINTQGWWMLTTSQGTLENYSGYTDVRVLMNTTASWFPFRYQEIKTRISNLKGLVRDWKNCIISFAKILELIYHHDLSSRSTPINQSPKSRPNSPIIGAIMSPQLWTNYCTKV